MDGSWLLQGLKYLIPLVLSLSVHEWAHAYAAYRLGDDTALRQGRLTLNPLAHIDPIGTLLLPMMGAPFGWARPVPINPVRFTRKVNVRTGMMITAAAGPASNVVLAVLCVVLLGLQSRFGFHNEALTRLLFDGFLINVVLALFNMLPIPPLDGSRIADWLVPMRLRPQWESFARIGPVLLLALIFLPQMLGVSLLNWPIMHAVHLADVLVRVIVRV